VRGASAARSERREPSMPSCPLCRQAGGGLELLGGILRLASAGARGAPGSVVEVEVARRALLEPEPVVLGRVLEEVRRLLEDVVLGGSVGERLLRLVGPRLLLGRRRLGLGSLRLDLGLLRLDRRDAIAR